MDTLDGQSRSVSKQCDWPALVNHVGVQPLTGWPKYGNDWLNGRKMQLKEWILHWLWVPKTYEPAGTGLFYTGEHSHAGGKNDMSSANSNRRVKNGKKYLTTRVWFSMCFHFIPSELMLLLTDPILLLYLPVLSGNDSPSLVETVYLLYNGTNR